MLQLFTELNVSLHLSINSQAAALFTLIAGNGANLLI